MEFLRRLFASKRHPYVPFRDRLETVSTSLSGTRFSIQLPPHSVPELDSRDPEPAINIHDPERYPKPVKTKQFRAGEHPGLLVLNREWCFRGAFWSRHDLGYLGLNVLVSHAHDMPETMSCLNPRHFEQIILRTLYFEYGPPQEVPPGQGYRAPVNWHVRVLDQHDWVYCEAHWDLDRSPPNKDEGTEYKCYLFTPLDDHHYLRAIFFCSAYAPLDLSSKIISELMEKIIGTIRIELSPDAKRRRDDIRQLHPHNRISAKRHPEQWVYHEWGPGDQAKGEDFRIVIKPGTPPPPFTP